MNYQFIRSLAAIVFLSALTYSSVVLAQDKPASSGMGTTKPAMGTTKPETGTTKPAMGTTKPAVRKHRRHRMQMHQTRRIHRTN